MKLPKRSFHTVLLTRGDHIGMISRMLLLDLKHAIKNKELYMLYQPQVYSDGICIGAEALLRWNHPVYGMIYPADNGTKLLI